MIVVNFYITCPHYLDFIPAKKIYFFSGEKQWELILHTILTRLKGNGHTASSSAWVQREDARSFKEEGQRAGRNWPFNLWFLIADRALHLWTLLIMWAALMHTLQECMTGDIIKTILLGAIKLYKYAISPLLPDSCRFVPTCSEYSAEAIKRYGAVKGSYLSLKRILRCHPFHNGGYDPVR